MRYEVKFCDSWKGFWRFEASNDAMAWQIAQEKINEHVLVVSVGIESIHELDCFDNPIRKLLPDAKESKERRKSEGATWDRQKVWIAYFSNGESSSPFFAEAPGDGTPYVSHVKNIATEKILKEYSRKKKLDIGKIKIEEVEQLVKNEIAVYEAHFSNGKRSAPYVATLLEGDVEALKLAEFKLKQHAQYNNLELAKLKVVKIIELNENRNFIPNLKRADRHKRRINKVPERKNRLIFSIDK